MKQSEQRSAWYSDNYVTRAPQKKSQPLQKRHRGLKITMIIVCVLILIVGSAIVFSDKDAPAAAGEGRDGQFGQHQQPPVDTDPGDFGRIEDFFRNYYTSYDTFEKSAIERVTPPGDWALPLRTAADSEMLTLQALYEKCAGSIVSIEGFTGNLDGYYWGTGIVLREDGYIVTNQHIISGTDRAVVLLPDGTEYDALLVGEDTQTDLAVLKIEAAGLIPADFGDSGEMRVGDDVAAIGNPLGSDLIGTMTTGIISAINRDMSLNGRQMTLLQTSAAINEGNSGGALINMYGQVIGITNMKMSSYYSTATVEGLGFAIPSTTVKNVVDQIMENGKVEGRPGLGITVGSIPDAAKEEYGLPDGLYITAVSDGSDAKAQGIRAGDVLMKVNGQTVTDSQEVIDIRDTCSVGDTLLFTIWRDGTVLEIPVRVYDLNDLY